MEGAVIVPPENFGGPNVSGNSSYFTLPSSTKVGSLTVDASKNHVESTNGTTFTIVDTSLIPLVLDVWFAKTAPTTPGAFTQPTGTLEIGDSKVFTVGASSDAECNLNKYLWEASINGGAYSKVGETAAPNLSYTVTKAICDASGLKNRGAKYRDNIGVLTRTYEPSILIEL